MSSSSPGVQSSALLSALSRELAAMMDTVESLSATISDHVGNSRGEARLRALKDAQAIDDLSQRLEALSAVTGAMARGDDAEAALAGVRLTDLSQRLRGAVPAASPVPTTFSAPAAQPVAGDLMLFE